MATQEILLGLKDQKNAPLMLSTISGEPKSSSTSKSPGVGSSTGVKRKYTAPSPEKVAQLREAREEKRRKIADAKSRGWLVVGVDFGVTFTGVSFIAAKNGGGDVQLIKEWCGGGRQNDLLEKVPSRYAFASENPGLVEDTWGYEVRGGMKSYSWFKLLLDEDTNAAAHDDPLLRQSAAQGLMNLPSGKTAKDLSADFLGQIYKHTQRRLGEVIGKAMMRETPCHYLLTLPATWSLKARKLTREAAQLAGFGARISYGVEDKLSMIDEPEAAAICAMKSTLENFPNTNPFEAGQGVIVVDLGGGTVDLVSYRIAKLEPLHLEELCVGIGAKCGGTSIDRALHHLMTCRYGEAFTSLPSTKIGPGSKFMDDFETIKRDFTGKDSNQNFEIHLKMRELDKKDRSVKQYDFEEDELTFDNSADMKDLFQVTVHRIQQLVLEQIDLIKKKKAGAIRTIILCGGLGSSPYIKMTFDKFCEEKFGAKIQVVRPVTPWSAVCKGAALRGLEVSPILSRRARCHYGFKVHVRFEDEEHDEEDAFEDPIYGKRAKNQMLWVVKKDEKLKPGATIQHSCTYTVPPNVHAYQGRENFYLCEDESAPARFGPRVFYAGEILINVTANILAQKRKKLEDEGLNVRKKSIPLDITLTITIGGEKGILEVSATSGKAKIGDAEVNYEANSKWKRASILDAKAQP